MYSAFHRRFQGQDTKRIIIKPTMDEESIAEDHS